MCLVYVGYLYNGNLLINSVVDSAATCDFVREVVDLTLFLIITYFFIRVLNTHYLMSSK